MKRKPQRNKYKKIDTFMDMDFLIFKLTFCCLVLKLPVCTHVITAVNAIQNCMKVY